MPFIHYHVFKNAGSSVDRTLQGTFGDRWRTFEGSKVFDIQNVESLIAFLERYPDTEAVSTHQGRPPVPAGCFPIAFLRHPIERCGSVYRFLSLRKDEAHAEALALGFPGWIDWALSGPRGLVIRNYQTVHFSSASFAPGGILNAVATENELAEAIDLFAEWSFVGIVAEFEKSIERFNEVYRIPLAGKHLKVFRSNVTLDDTSDETTRISTIRKDLGEKRYRRLLAANELDIRLYDYVKSRFSIGT